MNVTTLDTVIRDVRRRMATIYVAVFQDIDGIWKDDAMQSTVSTVLTRCFC